MSNCSQALYDYANGGFLHDPNISLAEFNFYAYGSSTPPSTFAPLLFPDRECNPIQRRRSREQVLRLITEY